MWMTKIYKGAHLESKGRLGLKKFVEEYEKVPEDVTCENGMA